MQSDNKISSSDMFFVSAVRNKIAQGKYVKIYRKEDQKNCIQYELSVKNCINYQMTLINIMVMMMMMMMMIMMMMIMMMMMMMLMIR